jgi:hypothetical protein
VIAFGLYLTNPPGKFHANLCCDPETLGIACRYRCVSACCGYICHSEKAWHIYAVFIIFRAVNIIDGVIV